MTSELATPTHPVRSIAYFGTPDVAVPPLQALHAANFDIKLVVTGEDKRRGRRSKPAPCEVKEAATELGLTVSHDPADVLDAEVDIGVVVAYGHIIKKSLLTNVPMINLHFSLLPRWRGAAPVERAILAGDTHTGVCVMAVAPKLDSGDIYAQHTVGIDDDATLEGLRSRLVSIGSAMLVDGLKQGLPTPVPQEGKPKYASKIDPSEHRLDFNRAATQLHRLIRLGSAWTTFREKRVKVTDAAVVLSAQVENDTEMLVGEVNSAGLVKTTDGFLQLIEVQPAGKKRMVAKAWLNGVQPQAGEQLG